MSEIEKQQRIEHGMECLAAGINDVLTEQFGGKGFALIVFEFAKPGISNYISNAKRADMITALRETADRLERNQDVPPACSTVQ